MNRLSICTIVTNDFVPWALAMYDSLSEYLDEVSFDVLIVDQENDYDKFGNTYEMINWHYIDEVITAVDHCVDIENIVLDRHVLRWISKSIFQLYLYQYKNYEKLIYVDGDIHFYDDISFIWGLLDVDRMLLTPHWIDIGATNRIFEIHNSGMYNAGFMASTYEAIEILEWWLKVCLFKCVDHPRYFKYDQGYLDIIPVYFDKVSILKHKGCNVAYWNSDCLKRYLSNDKPYVSDGEVEFPLVFYHFGRYRFHQFVAGADQKIYPILVLLDERLQKYGYKDNLIDIAHAQINMNKDDVPIMKRLQKEFKKILPFDIIKKI